MNYYNDNDKNICRWIEKLIKKELIPDGTIDDRDIRNIRPDELDGYVQCHFFAGICGWPYALRLAGWPDDRPVWTGSCPCQPFSVAGQGKGVDDDRHLWPAFRWLIAQCRPEQIFGEQVASKAGREWLAGVQLDLEAMGFAVGAADIPAAGVGAPHIRQRLWWLADSDRINGNRTRSLPGDDSRKWAEEEKIQGFKNIRLADSKGERRHRSAGTTEPAGREIIEANSGMGNSDSQGPQKRNGIGRIQSEPLGANPWQASKLAECRDGKQRRIPKAESAFPVVADGIPGRVALLRGIGNSIVPQVATEFIRAYLEVT